MAVRRIAIHADDLGASPAVNDRIFRCHREGVLQSASLMVNMPGTEDALNRLADYPDLEIGLHLNLLDGRPVSSPSSITLLVDHAGCFYPKVSHTLLRLTQPFRFQQYLGQVQTELSHQAKLFRQHLSGRGIDSHLHLHLLPWLFPIVRRVAEEFGFNEIRLPKRFLFLGDGGVADKVKAGLLGLLSNWQSQKLGGRADYLITGFPTLERLHEALASLPSQASVEVLFHPGGDEAFRDQLALLPAWRRNVYFAEGRRQETELLCSEQLRELLTRNRLL